MEMLYLQKIRYVNYITYIMKIRGLFVEDLVYRNSQLLLFGFFWDSLFEIVFVLFFIFAVFYYHGATVTLQFHDSMLIFSYIPFFQKSN